MRISLLWWPGLWDHYRRALTWLQTVHANPSLDRECFSKKAVFSSDCTCGHVGFVFVLGYSLPCDYFEVRSSDAWIRIILLTCTVGWHLLELPSWMYAFKQWWKIVFFINYWDVLRTTTQRVDWIKSVICFFVPECTIPQNYDNMKCGRECRRGVSFSPRRLTKPGK